MKLVTSVFLCIISIVFTGCTTNAPLTGTNKSPILPSKSQADQTPTTHITKAETDTDKTKTLKIGNISELKDDKTCDDVGDILVYAETRSYWVYICGNKQDTSQSSYFFKAKSKNDKDKPSIMGKASLGWRQTSFVGIKDNYTYSIDIPSVRTNSGSYKLPSLDIYPFNVKEITLNTEGVQHELLTKYLAVHQFQQARQLKGALLSYDRNQLLNPQKNKFIKYLMNNRESLNVCENHNHSEERTDHPDGRVEDSILYKLDKHRYLLQLRCNVYLQYNSFNFFVLSDKEDKIEVKNLTKPSYPNNSEPTDGKEYNKFDGQPLYDPQSKILSIWMRLSGNFKGCGFLTSYQLQDHSLNLLKVQGGSVDDCDKHLFINPILLPQIYP
jgi:hypothetical protein